MLKPTLRLKLWWKLTGKYAKLGEELPKWLIVIRFLAMPLDTIKKYALKEVYSMGSMSYCIEGVRISERWFQEIATGRAVGSLFKIVSISDSYGEVYVGIEEVK